MYSVKIGITNLAVSSNEDFNSASLAFIEELSTVPDLEVDAQTRKIKNTRGDITLLTGIIITAINIGAFSAIYTLAKDLYERYANAEVELQFEDGSTLILKHLTPKQAEKKIAEHLKRAKPSE